MARPRRPTCEEGSWRRHRHKIANEAKEADRAADIVRELSKEVFPWDPSGLDAEACSGFARSDQGLLGPRWGWLKPGPVAYRLVFTTRRFATAGVAMCSIVSGGGPPVTRAALRLVASALQRTEADRPPTPPTPTPVSTCAAAATPVDTEDGLAVQAAAATTHFSRRVGRLCEAR